MAANCDKLFSAVSLSRIDDAEFNKLYIDMRAVKHRLSDEKAIYEIHTRYYKRLEYVRPAVEVKAFISILGNLETHVMLPISCPIPLPSPSVEIVT